MKIQVLGSGCPTCKSLYELTKKALEELGIKEEVEYLTGQEGIQKIIEMGVMQSPVLLIDNKVALEGNISDLNALKDIIKDSLKEKE